MKKLILIHVMAALILVVLLLAKTDSVRAADFFCTSGDVTCLIAAVNSANATPGKHIINLEPGIYTFQTPVSNFTALPFITGSIQIQAIADEPPTVIERDPAAATIFTILRVSATGELTLSGLTVQRSSSPVSAITNLGVLSLQNCVITDK